MVVELVLVLGGSGGGIDGVELLSSMLLVGFRLIIINAFLASPVEASTRNISGMVRVHPSAEQRNDAKIRTWTTFEEPYLNVLPHPLHNEHGKLSYSCDRAIRNRLYVFHGRD